MKLFTFIFCCCLIISSTEMFSQVEINGSIQANLNPYIWQSKPYTRYWWFASKIKKEDVKWNLDWLKKNGFGGVEIAWVYPSNRNSKTDTVYMPRYEWLSPEWNEIVDYTIKYSDSIELGCDLTFGTLWPFGDSFVTFDQATQKYGEPDWRQKITASWQYPLEGYVIDHLTSENYLPYFNRLLQKFPRPNISKKQCYFIDSWEVETEKLWCKSFESDFEDKFDYDITEYMDSIYSPSNSKQLYDYMSLISDKVLKFYSDFTSTLNNSGILSRGQVSGAPCDLISGYALMDIPEGEAMLYEPEYNSIPASAALLANKPVVTAETFTCLYGWPRDFIRKEQVADLKLVSDAMFGNGINHIIWHGKAHNPAESDSVNFYASTHLGFSGNIATDLPEFNSYLEKVSSYMKKGATYSQAAVYLPTEDAWMKGIMPKNLQFKWAWGFYEMRYVYLPEELKPYSPIWINREFLRKANVVDGKMVIGNTKFEFIYLDSYFMDVESIKEIYRLADEGLKIVFKKFPNVAGTASETDFNKIISKLRKMDNVATEIPTDILPVISGTNIPKYWLRHDGKALFMFIPNPKSSNMKFPIEYGQAYSEELFRYDLNINFESKSYQITLNIEPNQSLLYKIENGKVEQIDINFIPKLPEIIKRPDGYEAPWLIK